MWPKVVDVTIILPWQPQQTIRVRQLNPFSWRFNMIDRLGRIVSFEGTAVAFNVRLFKSTDPYHLSHMAVYGDWEKALYRNAQGEHHDVDIVNIRG